MAKSIRYIKIRDLKEGMENVHVLVRVLRTTQPKIVHTRSGPRTLSEAIVGDESGRIKLTLWGDKAGTVDEDQVIDVSGAWTTSFRGNVQLNVGRRSIIKVVNDELVPKANEIPEEVPKARRLSRGPPERKGFKGRKGRNW
ncbi:MAG TPA: single-stranded DNA-binding protein [Acidilobales archaeon]|nr:single-stranded DNA-binding protein [Acidilobales archaeon]